MSLSICKCGFLFLPDEMCIWRTYSIPCYAIAYIPLFWGRGNMNLECFFFASYSNFRFKMILLNLWLDRQNTFSVAGCVNFQKFKKRRLQLHFLQSYVPRIKWIQCRIYQRMCTMCKVERTHIINSDR